MIGSSVFSLLERADRAEAYMRGVFVLAALSMLPAVLLPHSEIIIFLGFLVFELCIGVFWPAMGVLRARYVPESSSSSIFLLSLIVLFLVLSSPFFSYSLFTVQYIVASSK